MIFSRYALEENASLVTRSFMGGSLTKQFEKYDEEEVAPREKNKYPGQNDPRYHPSPVGIHIPPITPHEFKKRYDFCAPQPFHFRHHRKCHCVRLKRQIHSREIISLLPRKLARLDELSDSRELFWGLYARQKIYFWRILVYNVVCISPLIWFFFMWLFRWGHDKDMQNASVPLMVMISLLSIFWATFITSLRQGEAFT